MLIPPRPLYKIDRKVLIISETYRWGIVKFIRAKDNQYVYSISFANGEKPMTLPENALLPFIPRWIYNLKKKFNFIAW